MKAVLAFAGALSLVASSAFIACAPSDVIIANIPVDADGGKPQPPAPCVKDADCTQSQFCEQSSCGDQVGHCRNEPPFCDSTSATVCGCDGVTYWNDCLRALNGVSKDNDGICETGATCGGGGASATCANTNASCGKLVAHDDQCAGDGPGQCWVLPEDCPADDDPDWASCDHSSCADVCTAIKSGVTYFRGDKGRCD
ncbi:MAG: hypothetical protein ABI461_13770 [Polyangiaceae bacterium]